MPIIDTLSSVGIQVKAPPHILLRPAPPLRLLSMLRAGSPWHATRCAEVAVELVCCFEEAAEVVLYQEMVIFSRARASWHQIRRTHRNHLAGAEPNAHVSDEAKGPLSMTAQHMTFLSSPIAMVMLPPQLTCVACRRLSRFLCVPHTSTCDAHVSKTSTIVECKARERDRRAEATGVSRFDASPCPSCPKV